MFSDLFRRLSAPTTYSELDARTALGALLVRIARSDGHYDRGEVDRIESVLARRYGLTPDAVAKLRAECEALEADAPDTVRFTRAIKDAVPYEDRKGVIAALWAVVLADGVRDDAESALMRMVAPLLGVGDADSNRIRLDLEAAKR